MMRRITVGASPDFLDRPPNTGAGRVHHTVLAELYRRLVRRPRLWRTPEVWLTDSSGAEFNPSEPVVAICHGAEWLLDPSILELTPPEYWKPLIARIERGVRSATMTIVPSEYSRRAVVSGWEIEPERVVAVHHGVDPSRFQRTPGGRRMVAAILGDDRPYVAFVGVPGRAKGIAELRAAIGMLARHGYPQALVVAGPREQLWPVEWRTEVSSEIEGAPGRLAWIDNATDDELVPLLSDADAFCLPSVKESFGLPVLEAMACGAPVIVADRAALPEVVDDAGLLCEPTAEGIAAALRQVLDDPARARGLSERGRARAERMTWEHTAEGWAEVLERAAPEAR